MRNEEALCRSQSSQDELLAVARALKKLFAGNSERFERSCPDHGRGGKADLIILKLRKSMGNSEWEGKGKDGHSVALKAYPEYAPCRWILSG